MARLGDVFSVIRNGASIKQTDGAGGLPITRIETISSREVDRNKFGYAGIKDIDKYHEYILQDGDILMSHINSEKHLGKVALYKKQGDEIIIHGMNLLMLRANKALVYPPFAAYYFETNMFLNQIQRITKKSVNQASFTVTALKEIEMPLPPLEEQRRIAAMLDKVSDLIAKRRAQLDKLDLLVKARFVEMFGDQYTNPKGWETGTIRDVVSEVKYGTSRPAVEGGAYKYLRMGNITFDGHLDLNDLKYIDIPESEIEKCIVKKGDVLFNRTNSKELVGKTCVFNIDEPMVIAGYIIRVRVNERVLPDYLSAVLNSQYGKRTLADMCKAIVGQANINAQELQNIAILVPPIELQRQFLQFVNQVNKLASNINCGLGKLETLQKALMQQYFG